MRKAITTAAIVAMVLTSGVAMAADLGPTCEASKLGISAKYASCRLKADSKSVKTGDPVDYSKCSVSKFADAQTKAGSGNCPTEDDQKTVTDYLDDCTSRVATWLGTGSGLSATCASDLATCLSDCGATVRPPLKTGQTTAHGTGSDGDLEKGAVRSFTDNGDGTITDNTTGLMWEKKSDDGSIHDKDNTYTWSTGPNNMNGTMVTAFLTTLNGGGGFAGHTDWRIPNLNELESLRNLEVYQPATYSQFNDSCTGGCTVTTCSCTQSSDYWSSTTGQYGLSSAWYVNFSTGSTYYFNETSPYYVRAVRAGS